MSPPAGAGCDGKFKGMLSRRTLLKHLIARQETDMTPPAAVSEAIFGLSPLLVSLTIFRADYAVIVTEKINRSVRSRCSRRLMIFAGC